MSPRARPAAAALLSLLAITTMAAMGLSLALRLIARDLIDTAEGAGAEIYQQLQEPLLQAGTDPVKRLDDIKLQTFPWTSQDSRSNLVYAQFETAGGQVIPTAQRAATTWIPNRVSSIEELRRQSSSLIPLTLLAAFWSPRTFEFRRPVLLDGRNFGTIKVGVSTGFTGDEVRAQTKLLASSAILTFGVTWLAFCLLASRRSTAYDSTRPDRATNLIRAPLRNPHPLRSILPRLLGSPEAFGGSDAGDAALTNDSLVDLLDSIRDGALTIDGRGVVGFANSKARYLLGPQASIAGKPIKDSLGSEHPLVQILEAARAAPAKPQHVQLDVYGSENHLATIAVSTFPVNHNGGLVVLLGESVPIDEIQNGSCTSSFADGTQPKGAPPHSALVEITVSEQGKMGIHPSQVRELLDLYFAADHREISGSALVSRALKLHGAIGQEQVNDDQVIARIRLPVGSTQSIEPAMAASDGVALA